MPAKAKRIVGVWLTSEDVRRLDAIAKRLRNTRSGVIRLALDQLLAKENAA